MFREMRRKKQALSLDECKELLKFEPRGVLSMLGDDDYPYGIPMDFWYCEAENCLYFHGSMEGHKVDAFKKSDKVSFCVYDKGYLKEGEWALNIKSVIVFGRMSEIESEEKKIEVLRAMGPKYTEDTAYIEKEIATVLKRTAIRKLSIEHISGKLVNES